MSLVEKEMLEEFSSVEKLCTFGISSIIFFYNDVCTKKKYFDNLAAIAILLLIFKNFLF